MSRAGGPRPARPAWTSARLGTTLACGAAAAVTLQLLLHSLLTRAQPVVIAGAAGGQTSEGCLAHVPEPPTNVRAIAKDGRIVLSWDPPPDGSCVDTYVIDAYDATWRSGTGATSPGTPVMSGSTDATNYTMAGLQNGRTYRFRLQAFSSATRSASSAELVATPSDACTRVPPGKPVFLTVTPGQGMAQMCWLGVDNDACVDEYRVAATRADVGPFRSSSDPQPVSKGGCANISRLEDGVEYSFSVLAFSREFGEGPAARVTSRVGAAGPAQNGWTCRRQPSCRPNTLSLCAMTGCQGVNRGLGSCKGPAMYDIDYLRRLVTQWCSDVCACDLSVVSAFGPLSMGVITGLTEGVSRLAGWQAAAENTPPPPVAADLPHRDTTLAVPQVLPALAQGAATGWVSGIQRGAGLGSGLAANVVGSMMQATLASGVIGDSVGNAVGDVASSLVSNVVNNVVGGVAASLTGVGAG